VLKQVIAMTDAFCQARLNEEYLTLCRKLAQKLAGKRPSPLLQGEPRTWACGIIRTIGWVNFLADRSKSPHLKLPAIDQALGVAESTGQGKAKAIRRMLKIHQFKITLRGVTPPIWRRIQMFDAPLDKLHEHIQAAMGWTNSHLHHFFIQDRRCGDPELRGDEVEPFSGVDSTRTLLSELLPADRAPISFEYHYDFGASWVHDLRFEGSPAPQPGVEYPQCLEGERACPPEDVGGIEGYADYLAALADPSHEQHREMLEWNGPFNPNAFNPRLATHVMQEGIPNWDFCLRPR
jgi:hypothetical protein